MDKMLFILFILIEFICKCYTNDIKNKEQVNLDDAKTITDNRFEFILNEKLCNESNSQRILTRKRRYLVFPEGSSFQLVYDDIVGVVDYTNYLILGITVALAWELPSKPPSEILKDLKERLKDGTFGTSRNDTARNITYIDTKLLKNHNYATANKYYRPTQKLFHHQPLFSPLIQNNNYNPKNLRRKDSYYYSAKPNPFKKWMQPVKYNFPLSNNDFNLWWNKYSRISNTSHSLAKPFNYKNNVPYNTVHTNSRQNLQQTTGNYQSTTSPTRKHHIYPIFGKRSIKDDTTIENNIQTEQHTKKKMHSRQRRSGIIGGHLTKLDQIHIRHHRSTRQTFYEKIEKYLDKRGSKGHHCVLRALCETGQKSSELQPGSFVAELMRAIFTLPEPLDNERIDHNNKRYDDAHKLQNNCSSKFRLCKDSLWTSDFVM